MMEELLENSVTKDIIVYLEQLPKLLVRLGNTMINKVHQV